MTESTDLRACFSCGARVPESDVAPPDHVHSSPGCWAVYGEVLAREYENPALMANHQLTVDAYALQHPGDGHAERAARRSVYLHLIGLCAVLERELPPYRATRLIKKVAESGFEPQWFEPPVELGEVTVADVHDAGPAEHLEAVERWARSVWQAWFPHHAEIRRRLEVLL